jgi:hypothetical protein
VRIEINRLTRSNLSQRHLGKNIKTSKKNSRVYVDKKFDERIRLKSSIMREKFQVFYSSIS